VRKRIRALPSAFLKEAEDSPRRADRAHRFLSLRRFHALRSRLSADFQIHLSIYRIAIEAREARGWIPEGSSELAGSSWIKVDPRESRKQRTRTSERFLTQERNPFSRHFVRVDPQDNKLTARVSISHSTFGKQRNAFRKENCEFAMIETRESRLNDLASRTDRSPSKRQVASASKLISALAKPPSDRAPAPAIIITIWRFVISNNDDVAGRRDGER